MSSDCVELTIGSRSRTDRTLPAASRKKCPASRACIKVRPLDLQEAVRPSLIRRQRCHQSETALLLCLSVALVRVSSSTSPSMQILVALYSHDLT